MRSQLVGTSADERRQRVRGRSPVKRAERVRTRKSASPHGFEPRFTAPVLCLLALARRAQGAPAATTVFWAHLLAAHVSPTFPHGAMRCRIGVQRDLRRFACASSSSDGGDKSLQHSHRDFGSGRSRPSGPALSTARSSWTQRPPTFTYVPSFLQYPPTGLQTHKT